MAGFQGGSVVKNPPANAGDVRDADSILGWVRFPWRSAWQPTLVFLPGESCGQRSLAAAVHGVAESDTTEWLSTHTRTYSLCVWYFNSFLPSVDSYLSQTVLFLWPSCHDRLILLFLFSCNLYAISIWNFQNICCISFRQIPVSSFNLFRNSYPLSVQENRDPEMTDGIATANANKPMIFLYILI